MKIEMIAIGDELLDGRVIESNSARLARRLCILGLRLQRVSVVPDHRGRILEALKEAEHRGVDWLIVSGGLGITQDDLTREIVSAWTGRELKADSVTIEALKVRMAQSGRNWSEEYRGHLLILDGAEMLTNEVGIALGVNCPLPKGEGRFVLLPGVPSEFDAMVDAHIMPALGRTEGEGEQQIRLGFLGLGERRVERRLESLNLSEEIRVGITAKDSLIELALNASDKLLLTDASKRLEEILGDHLITRGGEALAVAAGRLLKGRGESFGVAESCTGGLIAHLMTEVPGSSAYFIEGVVTYANSSKRQRLGVQQKTLDKYGAVSRHTVREMARGVRAEAGVDWALATSGIAGPGGGRPGKPVGLVHMALEGPGVSWQFAFVFPSRSRSQTKRSAANSALGLLICALEGRDAWPPAPLSAEVEIDEL